jgi:leucyl-tRNA synthetase
MAAGLEAPDAVLIPAQPPGPRSRALQALLERRRGVPGSPGGPAADGRAREVLLELRRRGCLFSESRDGEGISLVYVPSEAAKASIFSDPPPAPWNEKLVQRQRKAFRSASGAIFRLPLAGREGAVECFITDWSPFPAAAAVAVHPDHPLGGGAGPLPRFTGTFVVHPLTGDLLPVWAARWVKPEIGTAAVIVNPAHSEVDLAFAREVGLPVRFALSTGAVTSDPVSWPTPPVVKQGTTIRTGAFDGLTVPDAMEAYFQALAAHGFARQHSDRGVGSLVAATAAGHSPSGELPATVEAAPWLETLLALSDSAPIEILCAASESAATLLFLRLAHFDWLQRPLAPQAVHLLQEVSAPEHPSTAVLNLAALIASPLDQAGAVKNQQIEQAETFLRRHKTLLTRPSPPADAGPGPEATRIRQALQAWDFRGAFQALNSWQKDLAAASGEKDAQLAHYRTVAHLLTGEPSQ